MFFNSIKVALRNVRRHKGFYFINIVGLTIGIICFILISLFVLDELSYDRYHENASQIYRVGVRALVQDNEFHGSTCCAPMAKTLVKEFPEVLASTRLRKFGTPVIRYQDKVFSEERWFWADATIFDVFTIPFIQGDPDTALIDPNSVVLTESMAEKYFGKEDPVGQTLNADNERDYLITGVVEDVPQNSHVHYDFLASFETLEFSHDQNWISNNFHTYFVLKKGASHKDFEAKLQILAEKYVYPQVKRALGVTPEEFLASGGEFEYFLQPLTEIHLHSQLQFEHEPNSSIVYVYIFSIIAIAILLIACINFVNLATARSAHRAKEVGVRKTVGSTRNQLGRQFIIESVFLSTLAVLLAIPFIELLLPFFNTLTGKNLSVPYLGNIVTIPLLIGISLGVGFLSGLYPAFYLSSFNPVAVFKGEFIGKRKSFWMRNSLVVFQFTVSVILIIGTFVVYKQLNFIQSRDLGFDREGIVIIRKANDLGQKIWPFKQELLGVPGISSVSTISDLMGDSFGDSLYVPADRPSDQRQLIWRMWADPDFVQTYKIELARGRFFSSEFLEGHRAVVLNESAVKSLDIENPVGRKLMDTDGQEFTIIGVAKDFHYDSLHNPIKPLLILPYGPDIGFGEFLSVRIATENVREILSMIENSWEKYAANQAFEYEFFDDYFARIYLSEEKTGQIFFLFTILAVAIACLGLFGLTSFVIQQRTKEIGVRKVFGASFSQVLFLLTKQFFRWILAANIIAWPVAYFVMHRWLENFAYRTSIGIGILVLSGAVAFLIALVTVGFQSFTAASANPVESLRYE